MRQLFGKIPYQQHARRHLPGGSDPLPLGSGGFPTDYHPMLTGADNTSPYSRHWSSYILDPNTRTNFQLINGDPDSVGNYAEDSKLYFGPIWLGPQNSAWRINMLYSSGPHSGKVDIHAATFPADATADLPDGIVGLDWQFMVTLDQYNGSVQRNQVLGNLFFYLGGADGDQCTVSFGNGDTTTGGSGLWAFRLSVNGKNVSSDDTRASISDFEVKRVPGELF